MSLNRPLLEEEELLVSSSGDAVNAEENDAGSVLSSTLDDMDDMDDMEGDDFLDDATVVNMCDVTDEDEQDQEGQRAVQYLKKQLARLERSANKRSTMIPIIAVTRRALTSTAILWIIYALAWVVIVERWVIADIQRNSASDKNKSESRFPPIATTLISLAFLNMLHLIRRRSHYIAKTPADVMRSLTAGLSSGTFAVSYSWGHWTKTVARNAFKCFANGVCWIDIRNILPGHRIQDTCAEAMANADAAIVFLSDQYLRSQNCCIELLNLEPQCARVLAAMRNNWIDDLQDAESNGGTGTMPDGGRRPRVAGTQRNTTEFDTYTLSQLLQREPGRASRLVVIVSLNAFDNQRELRTELVSILSNAGHYVWFARPSTEIQLRRRLPRLVLEGFLRINTFQDIYKRQQTTPAVNDYWHGTAASMFKTANLHIATPLLALLMWVVDGVFFVVANLQDDTTDTNLTSSGIELLIDIVAAALIIVALAVHIALVVAMRGSYSHKHMRWLWIINPLIGIEYLLSYISPPIAQSIDFASLPDAGYLLAIVVRLRIGKRLRVCAKGIAKMPQLVKGALRTLIQYGVIQMTDTQDQADFSLVCLDVDDDVTVRKPRLGFGSTGGVKLCVPENLDTSGATLYWTRFTLEDIVKVAPDAKTAMIKCSSNKQLTSAQACPGLETIFVQMLKRSLGLTLTAHVAAGRGNFEDIDFEDVQQSSFLSKLFA